MLGILDIEKAVPISARHVRDLARELNISRANSLMYERFFGLSLIPNDPDQSIKDMSWAALERLWKDNARPNFILHCHTLLSAGPLRSDSGHPTSLFRMDEGEVFSTTMCHCASGVAVFELLDGLLSGEETALILISDKAFHPAVQHIQNTTLMGDGAVALLVGRKPGQFRYLGSATKRYGEYSIITGHVGEDTDLDFADQYANITAETIRAGLKSAGVGIQDLRYILPHNVNIPSWEAIARDIGARRDQLFLRNIPSYGHTFGADPFLNLMDASARGEIVQGDLVALVSVGLGATASCAVFQADALSLVNQKGYENGC